MTSRPRSNRAKPQPAPAPIPEAEVVTPRSPLFLDPEPMPEATTPASSPEDLPPWSNSDPSGPVSAVDSPFGTPSTADPNAKANPNPPRRITRASVRKYAGVAVAMVLGYVAETLTKPDTIERHAGLWQPDEEDLQDMTDPVAGLVARRIPQKAGAALNPDVEDGFMLALALTKYVGKQWQRRQAIKAALAQQPADMTADDLEAVPA